MFNYGIDCYLNYKYRHTFTPTDTPPIQEYILTQLVIRDITYDKTKRNVAITKRIDHDLRRSPYRIEYDEICSVYDFNKNTVVYVHYRYGNNQYIFPYKFSNNEGSFELPLYSPEDMDSSIQIEYYLTETNNPVSNLPEIIRQFAGPKGNFYCDVALTVEPFLICDKYGHTIMNDDGDCLKLTTQMGHFMSIPSRYKIRINECFF
jgi:hypothetical protein